MCIYCGTKNYRGIYENHVGPIPRDNCGRSYEIHHIDGNRLNNDPTNLKCVTIQEHFDIHYDQGDWTACIYISNRMSISPEETKRIASKCASKNNKKLILAGKHNFMKNEEGTSLSSARVLAGTHNWLDGKIASETQKKLVKLGTHHFLGGKLQSKHSRLRAQNGTHPFLGGEMQKNLAKQRFENGTHPSQVYKTCLHCDVSVNLMIYGRMHGNKCSKNTLNK